MNKYLALLVVGLLLIAGCSSDPVSVATQFQDAVNSQDLESALELLAEDAVLQVDGTPSRTGKAEIKNWLVTQADLNYRIEGDPTASESGVAFENCSMSSDQWAFVRVNPMSGTCEVALEGGHITSFTIQFDENLKARLSDSGTAVSADLVEIWAGTSPDPEAVRYIPSFFQILEDGSARFAFSPEDLLIAPDSDHPGVRFTWTYEGYVLTVQNQGPAIEGYCQEQDVGTYLFRNTDEDGIQFKSISDPCVWRKDMLVRRGGDWNPYVP
jgi:hypothetical protein